ncbi:biorientation of chromosomes in cell division protein 1-like 1 isoform X2 [Malaya genurostris]|uniref:biorientation of chromosomes in cell division protein 1-like 1 isoform X2 n=1 Tax=Malaya genurostris TaxID=325434 RepID=UPI0026F3E545|nr:biorientation of chromosomes in cell division protein 1-like 1 isoform X2 [Malaya genurostris]
MDNLADDPGFIDAIVHEVKSQGLFDQFRKECLADVDTKPAYQNLRQRVETSVSKFLSQQKWSDNIRHKNQLREMLRRNIIESGFLDTGVERIVDQVVNPKISTVFHPKVEEIVYNYLGIEKPQPIINGGGLEANTDFLPEDLEAVSPDSDKKSSSTSSDVPNIVEHITNEDLNESKEHVDDFESPAFEPLETRPPSHVKNESNDSYGSAISGLTSQESVENEKVYVSKGLSSSEEQIGTTFAETNEQHGEKFINDDEIRIATSPDIVQNDSQLSQVSSNSRLSIITTSEKNIQSSQAIQDPALDITEEAQMPKFSENSNGEDGEISTSNDDEPDISETLKPQKSNFDLRKEKYEFKGTERNKLFSSIDSGRIENSEVSEKGESVHNYDLNKQQQVGSPSNEHPSISISSTVAVKYDDNSSHSERSLRICEDSLGDQRVIDASSHTENCDSVKTPLNDEHSTESAPDVDKIDGAQTEVITLAAMQQQVGLKKSSNIHRERIRDKEHDFKRSSSASQHYHSSSDDKRLHSSSKRGSTSRKPEKRKSENGNNNSHGENVKKNYDRKKNDDDHYSSHDKPVKKRRSTDRDSNDGTENIKSIKSSDHSPVGATMSDSTKQSHGSHKRTSDSHDGDTKTMYNTIANISKSTSNGLHKDPRKVKKIFKFSKDANRKNDINMDVFAFSFDKPAKLGKNGEIDHEKEVVQSSIMYEYNESGAEFCTEDQSSLSATEPSIQLGEDIIILEPMEMEKVINAETNSVNDKPLLPSLQNFPTTDPADLVILTTQPVVVDQMLTNGDNMDLELLIGEKQLCGDESTMGKIQQGLNAIKNKSRKPKIANNFNEARRLMKIRKQMEREDKKTQEQAMVLAKKLITGNGSAIEDDQGIELEFVCDGKRKSSAPIISSPVRQKVISSSSLDEKELQYFPEQEEVFPVNGLLFDCISKKTSQFSFPDDFKIEFLNVKLYSFSSNSAVQLITPENVPLMQKDKFNETFRTPVADAQKNYLQDSLCSDESQTISAIEVNCAREPRKSAERDSANPEIRTRYDTSPDSYVMETSDKDESVPVRENNGLTRNRKIMQNLGTNKSRRIGLPRPKVAVVDNTATLSVVISNTKSIEVVDSCIPHNNNNGIIKEQSYFSKDLCKNRSANSLRIRTRARAGDVFQAEVDI